MRDGIVFLCVRVFFVGGGQFNSSESLCSDCPLQPVWPVWCVNQSRQSLRGAAGWPGPPQVLGEPEASSGVQRAEQVQLQVAVIAVSGAADGVVLSAKFTRWLYTTSWWKDTTSW